MLLEGEQVYLRPIEESDLDDFCARGIVIGDKDPCGHGYGSEATKLMLEYGFRKLGLHRIELLVLDFNQRARYMYKKSGFAQEGTLREARLVDGNWHDIILMSVLEREKIS